MIRIGVIGYGHWGPNHVRVFNQISESKVVAVADLDVKRLAACQRQHPSVRVTENLDAMIADPEIDALVVATPVVTHFDLVRQALLAGKDVLVEKPMTRTVAEAEQLTQLADDRKRVLMTGYVFLFNPGIRKLKQYVDDQSLGRLYYMVSTRTNLGPLRSDVNALHDLGSHDVAIFHHLIGKPALEVGAWGNWYLQPQIEDITFACLQFPNRIQCNMHVSWLNPRKERTLVIVGDQKMAVWDDVNPIEPIRLYDKGVMQKPSYDSFGQFHLVLRDADILIPKVPPEEPLQLQNRHFIDCVTHRRVPLTDARFAVEIARTLEALQRSLKNKGACQAVTS
jgi:predicted dehydrogenase